MNVHIIRPYQPVTLLTSLVVYVNAEKVEHPLTHSHRVRQARTGHYTGHRGILGQHVGFHAEREKNVLQFMNSSPH